MEDSGRIYVSSLRYVLPIATFCNVCQHLIFFTIHICKDASFFPLKEVWEVFGLVLGDE